MIHRKIFNLIINNINFDRLRIDKKIKFSIWLNDIEIIINDNMINIHLNGIWTSGIFEKGNYWDYVIKLWNVIDTVIIFYLNDKDTRHRTDDEVLEFRND